MGWTDERVELLKKLWADGLSASQIAAELGGITRNAVIGKVHRLGLSGRAKSPSSATPRPRKPRSSGHMLRVSRPSVRGNTALAYDYDVEPEPELLEIPLEQRKTLLQLNEHTCRWPIGDPGSRSSSSAAARPPTNCPIAPITRASPISRPRPPAREAAFPRVSGSHISRCRWPGRLLPAIFVLRRYRATRPTRPLDRPLAGQAFPSMPACAS